MTTASSANMAIEKNIVNEVEWDPEVEAAHSSVEVEEGIVVLSGTVKTYSDYKAAERSAFRVAGVRAVIPNAHDCSVCEETLQSRNSQRLYVSRE